MKTIFITLLCVGTLLTQARANDLSQFAVRSGDVKARFTVKQVGSMLKEGSTCVKKGRKVYFQSKNITEAHCKESTTLGLRVIRVKQLPLAMFNQILNLKPIK